MRAKRYKIGYCLTAAALAVLLFLFSPSILLWMLLLAAGLAVFLFFALRIDARHFSLQFNIASERLVGWPLALFFTAVRARRFWAAGTAEVELEIQHVMSGETQRQWVRFSPQDGQEKFSAALTIPVCGETIFRCKQVRLWDVFGLFAIDCPKFPETRAIFYPKPVHIHLVLSRAVTGSIHAEGFMQNRTGSDHSEIYNIRDYIPGDDIRSIHWKLSSKTDNLIVREASDPSHYNIALLPDFGQSQQTTAVSYTELNRAVALVIAVSKQLLRYGISFCLLIPSKTGLQICEIHSIRELYQFLPQWMSLEIPTYSGMGLRYFTLEHLEQQFTRLLIVSPGKYTQSFSSLGKRTAVSVLSTEDHAAQPSYTTLGAFSESVVLPTDPTPSEVYRIIC